MDKKNSLINLGCRLNIYEGEIIKNHLSNNNIKNITVINSCAVTAEAEKKVAYEIRKAKRTNPENKIIVTGCAAQIDPKKYHTLKEVDLVLGNKEKLLSDVWSNLNFSKPIQVDNILSEKKQFLLQLKSLMVNQEHILKFNKVVIIVVHFASYLMVEETTEVCQREK